MLKKLRAAAKKRNTTREAASMLRRAQATAAAPPATAATPATAASQASVSTDLDVRPRGSAGSSLASPQPQPRCAQSSSHPRSSGLTPAFARVPDGGGFTVVDSEPLLRRYTWHCHIDAPTDADRQRILERGCATGRVCRFAMLPIAPVDIKPSAVELRVVLSMRQTAAQLGELLLPADWQLLSFDHGAWAAFVDECRAAGGTVRDETHQGLVSAERSLTSRLESVFVQLLSDAGVEEPQSYVPSARELGWLAPLGDPYFDAFVFGDKFGPFGDRPNEKERLCIFVHEVALRCATYLRFMEAATAANTAPRLPCYSIMLWRLPLEDALKQGFNYSQGWRTTGGLHFCSTCAQQRGHDGPPPGHVCACWAGASTPCDVCQGCVHVDYAAERWYPADLRSVVVKGGNLTNQARCMRYSHGGPLESSGQGQELLLRGVCIGPRTYGPATYLDTFKAAWSTSNDDWQDFDTLVSGDPQLQSFEHMKATVLDDSRAARNSRRDFPALQDSNGIEFVQWFCARHAPPPFDYREEDDLDLALSTRLPTLSGLHPRVRDAQKLECKFTCQPYSAEHRGADVARLGLSDSQLSVMFGTAFHSEPAAWIKLRDVRVSTNAQRFPPRLSLASVRALETVCGRWLDDQKDERFYNKQTLQPKDGVTNAIHCLQVEILPQFS